MKTPATKGMVGLLFLFGLAFAPRTEAASPDPFVPPGNDCFVTPCGGTQVNFCGFPLPADFFAPGSEPFQGEVRLMGADPTLPDTVVRRTQSMTLLLDSPPETIPIELVQLSLVSCNPITVRINNQDTLWNVGVDLSPRPAPPGTMTVRKTHANGGTFTSDFYVQPRFTFTLVSDPNQVRVLDTGQLNLPPIELQRIAPAPWVHQVDPLIAPAACGVNFVPGVQEDLHGKNAGAQCCTDVCHAGATNTHCVVVAQDCSGCKGACCLPTGRCHVFPAGGTQTSEQACVARNGSYAGHGTDCGDYDGDGIADIRETNNCCAPKSVCSLGTSPVVADTDGDGFDDGTEIKKGTDPCDPLSFPPK